MTSRIHTRSLVLAGLAAMLLAEPDAMVRGTDAFVCDCLVMFAVPFQWDSRTYN